MWRRLPRNSYVGGRDRDRKKAAGRKRFLFAISLKNAVLYYITKLTQIERDMRGERGSRRDEKKMGKKSIESLSFVSGVYFRRNHFSPKERISLSLSLSISCGKFVDVALDPFLSLKG